MLRLPKSCLQLSWVQTEARPRLRKGTTEDLRKLSCTASEATRNHLPERVCPIAPEGSQHTEEPHWPESALQSRPRKRERLVHAPSSARRQTVQPSHRAFRRIAL